jgi:hypothetical protein
MDSITYIRDKSPESGRPVVGWPLSGNGSGNAREPRHSSNLTCGVKAIGREPLESLPGRGNASFYDDLPKGDVANESSSTRTVIPT